MYQLQGKVSETFKSFDDAISVLEKHERQDYLGSNFSVNSEGKLIFTFGDSGSNRELHFTDVGLRRMLKELKIPESYAFKIIDNELLSRNINELISQVGTSQVVTEQIHNQEFITGFRKSYVDPLRDSEVIEILQERLSMDSINIRHLTRSQVDFRLHYFNTGQNLDYLQKNEAISMGGEIVYSEYGSQPMTSQAALLIQWCTNGCVLDESIFKMTYKHDGDRYKAVEAVNRSVEGLLGASGEGLPLIFNSMKKRKPTEKMFRSIRSRSAKLVPEDLFDTNVNGDMSFWNTFQEITKMAHENTATPDDRRALEIVGGNLISAVGKDENWRLITQPVSVN